MAKKGSLMADLEVLHCTVHITDETGTVPVDTIAALMKVPLQVLEAERAKWSWDISILLTNDVKLRKLHRDYLNDDTETDIITFNYGAAGFKMFKFGEMTISLDRTRENAVEEGWSWQQELVFLVIHGTLHLVGWKDGTDNARSKMLNRQHVIMKSLK